MVLVPFIKILDYVNDTFSIHNVTNGLHIFYAMLRQVTVLSLTNFYATPHCTGLVGAFPGFRNAGLLKRDSCVGKMFIMCAKMFKNVSIFVANYVAKMYILKHINDLKMSH